MNKISRVSWTLVVALSMVLSGCGGASPQQAPTSAPPSGAGTAAAPSGAGTAAAPSEAGTSAPSTGGGTPVTIKVFTQQGSGWDFKTNWFTQQAEKMFNINFQWQTTTWDVTAAKEARQISLASGDYPDLYLLIPWVDQFSQAELIKYGHQGIIIPLNDLIDKYGPNIKAAMAKYPWYKAMATAPDGKIYGLPQLIGCYHCSYPLKMWINTAWLNKLHLQMPKTTDDFKKVLEAFKAQDPNGNGKADEIPLSGSSQFLGTEPYPYLLMAYTYYPVADNVMEVPLVVNNGKVDTSANKPETQDGLKYVAQLYKEGLIDPSAFSQNQEALQKLGNNPGVEILGAVPTLHPRVFVSDLNYSKDYNPVPPLSGPNGVSFTMYSNPSTPGATFVLTNKASQAAQVAAVKLVDYMFTTDGQLNAYWGQEGVDWRRPKPGDVAVNPSAKPIFTEIPPPKGKAHNGWQPVAQYYEPKEWYDGWVVGTDIYDPTNYARRLQQATDLYAGKEPKELFPFWAIWQDPTVADEQATLQTNLGNFVKQNVLQFITGAKSLDTDWNAYVQGLDQLGLSRYLQIEQAAYDNYKKTSGPTAQP